MTRDRAWMRLAANWCLSAAIAGAVLIFAVPGGNWSDVPGAVLLVGGAAGEILLTLAHLLSRSR